MGYRVTGDVSFRGGKYRGCVRSERWMGNG